MLDSSTLSEAPLVATNYFFEQDNPALAAQLFRFRKNVLVDLHGWSLPVHDDEERDEFDRPDTIHCALRRDGRIVGAFRALRADTSYLALTKFPHLATYRGYTRSPLCWEISRLTIAPDERRFETSLLVYAAMFHFVKSRRGRSIVGFCDLGHQRLLGRLGVTTEPYGEPAVIGTDAFGRPITVVAGEMPLPAQHGLRFEKLMSLTARMEIHDEDSVFGRACLSA